jgi:hypothetical protein
MLQKGLMKLVMFCLALTTVTGCATLDVTPKKDLAPATGKQPVTIGIQASGDRRREVLRDTESSVVKSATGSLFDKVILLPPDTRFQQPADVLASYGTDYILAIGIGDISVNGDLNPIWFASLPLLFFKIYTPIVTFEPTVSLDVILRDARSGAILIQKQVSESSADHYSPSNPSEKVRQLISMTINNALVSIMRESQTSIAAARQGKQ